MKVEVVGIPWYSRENWPALLDVFDDAHVLPDTFEAWLERANDLAHGLERRGLKVYKIDLDPRTFPDWCRDRGLNIDADARQRFASESAARLYTERE